MKRTDSQAASGAPSCTPACECVTRRDVFFGLLLSLAALAMLSGCAMGPNYKRPAVEAPPDFRFAASPTTNCFADLPWWEVFKDPTLLGLIQAAVTNNYDLRRAVARVEQARNLAVIRTSRSDTSPGAA